MRYREKLNSASDGSFRYCWIPASGSGRMDQTIYYLNTSSRAGMYDVVTEGFSRKRNQGVIVNNPMFSEETHYRYTPCRWLLDGRNGSTNIHCEYYGNHSILQVPNGGYVLSDLGAFKSLMTSYQTQIDLAVTRAWADVDVSEMQILASLGELPETIGWIASLLTRGIRLTKNFKRKLDTSAITRSLQYAFDERGLRKDARRLSSWLKILERRAASRPKADIIGDVSKLYLEYRYAMRPLIFDLQSALKALHKQLVNQRLTARGKEIVVHDTKTTTVLPRNGTYSASHYVDMTVEERVKAELNVRAGVLYAIEDGLNDFLSVWGFDQPLESLWELVPFSFIVDWFFSVGDYISSWSQSSGLSPLSSWVTVTLNSLTERKTVSVDILNRDEYVWTSKTVEPGSSYWTTRRKWRVPSPVRPLLPSFDLRLNLGKILDLGAIGRQMLGQEGVPRYIRR